MPFNGISIKCAISDWQTTRDHKQALCNYLAQLDGQDVNDLFYEPVLAEVEHPMLGDMIMQYTVVIKPAANMLHNRGTLCKIKYGMDKDILY